MPLVVPRTQYRLVRITTRTKPVAMLSKVTLENGLQNLAQSRLHDPVPGGGLWAAGPYDASFDCDGELALFNGMPVSIFVEDDVTPVEPTSFGGVKALYR